MKLVFALMAFILNSCFLLPTVMQYPVPQFTEVEDRIIGPLTLKQFGIIFAASIVVFLAWTASKSTLITAFVFMVVGFPALFIAFFKVNGRPLYKTFPVFFKFLMSDKVLVFHKEGSLVSASTKMIDAGLKSAERKEIQPKENTQMRLKEVAKLLQKQREEEETLLRK